MFGKIFDNNKVKATATPAIEKVRRTTDDVLKAFSRTLEELNEVRDSHAAEALRQREIAAIAAGRADNAEAESKKADSIASKLKTLITA